MNRAHVPRSLYWLSVPALLFVLVQGVGFAAELLDGRLSRTTELRLGYAMLLALATAPPALLGSVIIAVMAERRARDQRLTTRGMWWVVGASAIVNVWMYGITR